MKLRIRGWLGLGALMVCSTISASGCPVCNTETGEAVRNGILGDEFGGTMLAILLPLPAFAICVAGVCRWLGKE